MPPRLESWHPAAKAEAQDILRWYTDRNLDKASEFSLELDEAVEQIRENPRRFSRLDGNIRRALLRTYPYAVVYRETEHEILILAIAHGKRRPGYWRKRTF
jgi:plasmid stabilization system protein ParE